MARPGAGGGLQDRMLEFQNTRITQGIPSPESCVQAREGLAFQRPTASSGLPMERHALAVALDPPRSSSSQAWRASAHKPLSVGGREQAGLGAPGESQGPFLKEELRRRGLTRWNGCAICLRKYLATWTPSSTVRLRLASVRCSWIQRGSFPRLSARAKRCEWEREDVRILAGGTRNWGNSLVGGGPRNAHLVGKDHEAVVSLAPDGPTHALGRVAHGIEGQKVILSNLELVPKVFQPRLRVQRWGG